MGPTSRQRRIVEADMSRRQFLKLTGKAAAAAAAPQSALQGLAGSLVPAIPAAKVAVAIRPEISLNMEAALAGIQNAYNAAKKIGGKVGGAAAGCGEEFEIITFSDMDAINQLIKSGKLKQVTVKGETTTLDRFNKPPSPEDIARLTEQGKQAALEYLKNDEKWGHLNKLKSDPVKLKEFVDNCIKNTISAETYNRSELRFHDGKGNNYWITADNDVMKSKMNWFKDVVKTGENQDPLGDWWEMYFGYTDLADVEFSKPALEFIKQKGLYRGHDDPHGMRRMIDAFNEFDVPLPKDMPQVLEKFKKRHPDFDDIKSGEDWHDYQERKKQLKQKIEYEMLPAPDEEPESWRTQSVEFESRLHRLL